MDQERRLPAPARTPDDPERLARLRAEVWWNALTAPPARPRGRVYRPLYVLLLGWLFRERPSRN